MSLLSRPNDQVSENSPGGDKGGSVVGKDGKAYQAKKDPNDQGRC
jgi:hypothetical protein